MAGYGNFNSGYSSGSDGSMTELTNPDDDVSVPPGEPNQGWFSGWIGKIQNVWRSLSDTATNWAEESAVLLGYLDPSDFYESPDPILENEETLRTNINAELDKNEADFVDEIIRAYESEDESQQGCCKSADDKSVDEKAEEERENTTNVAAMQEDLGDPARSAAAIVDPALSVDDIKDDITYIRHYNATKTAQYSAQVPSEIGIPFGLQTPPRGSASPGSPGSPGSQYAFSELTNSPGSKKGSPSSSQKVYSQSDGSESDTESSAASSGNSYRTEATGVIMTIYGNKLTKALADGNMNDLYKMIAKTLYVKDVLLNVRDAASRRKGNELQMQQVWGADIINFAKSERACCYICQQPLVPSEDGGQPEMEHKLPCALFYALFVFIYTTYPILLGLWQEFIRINEKYDELEKLYLYINCTTHNSPKEFADGLNALWDPIMEEFYTFVRGRDTGGENMPNFLCVLLAYLMECAYAHHLCNQLKSNHLLFKKEIIDDYYNALKATLNPPKGPCDLSTHFCIKPAVFEPATCNAERDTIMRGLEPPPPNPKGVFPVNTKRSVYIQMDYIRNLAIECGNIGVDKAGGGQRSQAEIAIRNIKIAVHESKPVSAGSDVNGKVSMKRAKQMNTLARDYTGKVSIYVNKLNALRKCGIPVFYLSKEGRDKQVKNFKEKLDVVVPEAVDVANTIISNARSHLHNPYLATKLKQNLCRTILKYKDALNNLHIEMQTKQWNDSPSDNYLRITDALRRITRFLTIKSVRKYLVGTTLATIAEGSEEPDDAAGDAKEDMLAASAAAAADLGYASMAMTDNLDDITFQNALPQHVRKQGVVRSAKAAGGSENYGLLGATTGMEMSDELESELKKRPLSSEWSNELQPRVAYPSANNSNSMREENPRRIEQARQIAIVVVKRVLSEISRERAFANPGAIERDMHQAAYNAALIELRRNSINDVAMKAAREAARKAMKPNDDSSTSSGFSRGLGGGSRKRKPSKIPRRTIRRGAPRRTQRRTQKCRRMQGRRFTRQRKNNKRRTTQKRR